MGIAYCTREDVMSSLAFDQTSRLSAAVDRAIQAGSRSLESLLHRTFYPVAATKTFKVNGQRHLWLDNNEAISISAIEADGVLISSSNYTLQPYSGPPYTVLDFAGGVSSGDDDELDVTGVFGHSDAQRDAGTLAVAIATTSATTCTVSDGSLVGIGDVLKIDTERLIVTGRTWVTSAQTGSLSASNADRTLAVATGSPFHVGEPLLIDSERVLIEDISGNTLTVKRAQGGSVLAVHTTATVYVSRVLEVLRGQLGSTAATHLINAPATALEPPALVHSLAIAEALNILLQESGGYSRETGSSDNRASQPGVGLDALRRQAYAELGRKARMRSVSWASR